MATKQSKEISRWKLIPAISSDVEARGRRQLLLLPPADAQKIRKAVRENQLTFQNAFHIQALQMSLSQLEADCGHRFDDQHCRVSLEGQQVPWQRIPDPPDYVIDKAGGNFTAVSESLRKLHAACLLPCSSVGNNNFFGFGSLRNDTDSSKTIEDSQESLAGLSSLANALRIQNLNSDFKRFGKNNRFEYSPTAVLNMVRLGDEIKDLSQIKTIVTSVFHMVLSPELAQHLLHQELRLPSAVTVYRQRLLVDLATMLYSRYYLFNPSLDWCCHIRADSSPQAGKDYFVCECDYVSLTSVTDETSFLNFGVCIRRRILPLQLLGERASATENKVFRLNLALSADTMDVETTLLRSYSLTFDMGTESKIFTAPACLSTHHEQSRQLVSGQSGGQALDLVHISVQEQIFEADIAQRLCPRALPFSDSDHVSCLCLLGMFLLGTPVGSRDGSWYVFYASQTKYTKNKYPKLQHKLKIRLFFLFIKCVLVF